MSHRIRPSFVDVSGDMHVHQHFHGRSSISFFQGGPIAKARRILEKQTRENGPEVKLEQSRRWDRSQPK